MMKTLIDNIRIVLVCLLSLFAWLLPTQSSVACSAHNHLCSYHALGTPRTSYDVSNDETRLVIIAKATDTSHGANKTDFDNHVLLPKETTSFDIVGNPTTESTEPFIFRKTRYGLNNISDVSQWETPDTQGRHVYSSQYQVIYNKNTAQAIHTGDLNGGEKGRTPYQSGCPAYEGKANCEAIVITGNVPSGTYSQIVQMFNHHNKDNPKANLILGAWTTGDGILISNSHLNGNTEASVGQINQTLNNGTTESYNSTVLEGNKAQTLQYDYNFYNRGFKPHAIGTTSWNHNKQYHPMGFSEPYNVTNHKKGVIETKKDAYYRTSLDTTNVNHLGEAQTTRNYGRVYKGRTLTTSVTPILQPSIQVNKLKSSDNDVIYFKYAFAKDGYPNMPIRTQYLIDNPELAKKLLLKEFYATEEYEFNKNLFEGLDEGIRKGLSEPIDKLPYQDFLVSTTLDFTPIVGDIKGFVEAETPMDYAFATIGIVPLYGDLAKKSYDASKTIDNATDVISDAKKLEDLTNVSKIDFDNHIINGEINSRGKLVGAHSATAGNNVRLDEIIIPPDSNGVYKAKVSIEDPNNPGKYISKNSTMFPDSWNSEKIKLEVEGAFSSKDVFIDNGQEKWRGTTPSGIAVEGYLKPKVTVYPLIENQ